MKFFNTVEIIRFENLSRHLGQLSKGVLVSFFTFAGYGLAKRLGGKVSSETQIVDSPAQARSLASQKSPHPMISQISQISSPVSEPKETPREKTPQKKSVSRSGLKLEGQHAAYKHHEPSFAKELGISFHEKEAEPTVTTHVIDTEDPKPENFTIIVGEEFRIEIPGFQVGADGKTYFFGSLQATQADGSPLPAWIHLDSPPTPFVPNIIGNVKTGTSHRIVLQKDFAVVAANEAGLQLVNFSDPQHPKIISNLPLSGGFAEDVTIKRDVVLVAEGTGLLLVNISDPKHPKLIGKQILPGHTLGVDIDRRKGVALVAANEAGLQFVNISDTWRPKIISTQALPGNAENVIVQRDVALVAASSAGLQLVNISDTRHPKIISGQALPGIAHIAVQGDIALVTAGKNGLQLMNISNPNSPKLISRQALPGDVYYSTAQGDWALVAAYSAGLQIVDFRLPTLPRIVAQVKLNSDVYSVAVRKNLALIGCRNSLKIIDLKAWAWVLRGIAPGTERGLSKTILIRSQSLPDVIYRKTLHIYSSSRPVIRKTIPGLNVRPGQMLSYRFVSEFVDVVDGVLPFANLEFSQLANDYTLPSWLSVNYEPMLSSLTLPESVWGLTVNRDIAFAAAGTGGLRLVNISDAQHPIHIGSQSLPGFAGRVTIQGDIALVAASSAGLQVVDISNPQHPKNISHLIGDTRGIAIQGTVALVAAGRAGLKLVNITNPKHPQLISVQVPPGSANDVAIRGNVAFVAASSTGLQLVNISNPQHPEHIGSQSLLGFTQHVTVQGNLALVTASGNGLHLVNVSNPLHPKYISSPTLLNGASDVAVEGSVALVVSSQGLQLINIHRSQYPAIIDSIDTIGIAYSVTIRDNIAFVGTSTGLNIIQYGLSGAVLRGQPNKADHKNYYIVIAATNFDGVVGNTTFRISVNNPPVWQAPIAVKMVNVGQVVSFQLAEDVFWDEDNDSLTFTPSLSNGKRLPNWITFFADGQIFTIIPSPNNRGRYNVSVTVDDGYFGKAQAWFSLIVPTRKPVKESDIPSQNAFIWRLFELLVSGSTFKDLDGDELTYRAQLKGARALPEWLHFDNTTCRTSCHFHGQPGVTDVNDLEIELIAASTGGEISAGFTISVKTSTLFQDLATYYSASGGGLVVISLLLRLVRWYKMRQMNSSDVFEIGTDVGLEEEKDTQKQGVEIALKNLSQSVEERKTSLIAQQVHQYRQQVLQYAKQHLLSVVEIAYPWKVIKKIVDELEIRTMHKLNYQDIFTWNEALQQLLQLVIETETGRGYSIMKSNKEELLAQISKIEKYINLNKKYGIAIKHQLQLCREALVSMDDTDSLQDNLSCRDSEMLVDVIKTMIAPPYGIVRLMYQISNIPAGWYPLFIQLCRLAEEAVANGKKLADLQSRLSQQKDWRFVYAGVCLLGRIGRESQDEKIQKQVIDGVQGQTHGLTYYQHYQGFWGKYSLRVDKPSAWIRECARAEISRMRPDSMEIDDEVGGITMQPLAQPLLRIQ